MRSIKSIKLENYPYQFAIIPTIGDGSCLLHSILFCFNKTYRSFGVKERIQMVDQLRMYLSKVLEEEENGKSYYDSLSRGELREISKFVGEANIEYMKKYLHSRNWLTIVYLELISNQLNLDIIIVDQKTKKVYNTGDKEIYFKGRNTVIINYIENMHFESMGLITNEGIKTFFSSDCQIVKDLKNM